MLIQPFKSALERNFESTFALKAFRNANNKIYLRKRKSLYCILSANMIKCLSAAACGKVGLMQACGCYYIILYGGTMMYKRIIAAALAAVLAFSAAACGTDTAEDTSSAESAVSQSSEDTSDAEGQDSTESSEMSEASSGSSEETDVESVPYSDVLMYGSITQEDDTVTVEVPSDFYDYMESTVEQALAEDGIISAVENDDSSFTYVFTEEYYESILAQARVYIDMNVQELIEATEFETITSIEYDKDSFLQTTITVTSDEEYQESTDDAMVVLTIELLVMTYATMLPDDAEVSFIMLDADGNELQNDSLSDILGE